MTNVHQKGQKSKAITKDDIIEAIDNMDIPLEFVVDATGRSVLCLEDVFNKNKEMGAAAPNNKLSFLYSMQGVQEQVNEVIREQYKKQSERGHETLACFVYYAEVLKPKTINIRCMSCVLDERKMSRKLFHSELTEKYGGLIVMAVSSYDFNNPYDSGGFLKALAIRKIRRREVLYAKGK